MTTTTVYICDDCGEEFVELGAYNVCPACSALVATRCAEDPTYAAAVAAQLAGEEGENDMDADTIAQVVRIGEAEWVIRDDAEGRLIGPFYSLELAETEADSLLAHRVKGGQL